MTLRRLAVSLYAAPPDLPPERFCAMLAARGIGGIGLTPPVVMAMQPQALADMLARHGLRASSLNSAGYLLHADPRAAEEQAALDARLIAAAAALRAPVNLIPGGLLAAGPGRHDPDRLRAALAEPLAALARRAEAADVTLSLEPMHPVALGLRSVVNSIAAARAILPAGHGLTLDLFHSHWDADFAPLLRDAPGLLRVVQLCGVTLPADGVAPTRTRLGAGQIDVAAWLRGLDSAGYDGMIEYEVFFEPMGSPAPEALLDQAVEDFRALHEETSR